MKTLCILTVIAVMLGSVNTNIMQLTDKNFLQKVNESPYTLVYFYSSSCQYCKDFTPKFERLSNNSQLIRRNISFAQIDSIAYKIFTERYEIYIFPTIAVFFKDIPLPVYYRKEREEKPLAEYLLKIIHPFNQPQLLEQINKLTPHQIVANKFALFKGQKDSMEFKLWDIIAKRDGYIRWAFVEDESPKVVIGTQQFDNFDDLNLLEKQVEAIYARLHQLTQQSWLKLIDKKRFSIVYINKFSNKKTKKLLQKLSKDFPNVHFLQIDAEQDDYKKAVRFLGLGDEENIFSVDKLRNLIFAAPSPYTEQGLKEFIQKARERELKMFRKSEKSDKPNKLTRENYDQRMSTNQDVLLFLYNRKEPISKEIMKVFESLLVKLKNNKNILLLRCDIKLNEIQQKLGFFVKKTPRIVFFRNRMKDFPIHYTSQSISVKAVIEFILENTTFDFEL